MRYVAFILIVVIVAVFVSCSIYIEPHNRTRKTENVGISSYHGWQIVTTRMAMAGTLPCDRQPVYRSTGTDNPAPPEYPYNPYPICQ